MSVFSNRGYTMHSSETGGGPPASIFVFLLYQFLRGLLKGMAGLRIRRPVREKNRAGYESAEKDKNRIECEKIVTLKETLHPAT